MLYFIPVFEYMYPNQINAMICVTYLLYFVNRIIYIIGFITGPHQFFAPHPRHENVAIERIQESDVRCRVPHGGSPPKQKLRHRELVRCS